MINPLTMKVSHFNIPWRKSNITPILSITGDGQNRLWVATGNKGIFQISSDRNLLKRYNHNPHVVDTLSDNLIKKIFIDKNQTLWAASKVSLNKLSLKSNLFNLQRPLINQNSLSNDPIVGVHEDSQGYIWILQKKLLRFNLNTGAYDQPYKQSEKYNENIFSQLYAITSDNKNNIWLTSGVNKIVHYDIGHNVIRYYSSKQLEKYGLKYKTITGLFHDNNNLWISTDQGLYKFLWQENKITIVQFLPKNISNFRQVSILDIYSDEYDFTWIGTTYGLFQLKNNKLLNYYKYTTEENVIADNIIYGITGNKDNLWIGTQSGLSKYNYKNKSFSLISMQDGLSDNIIYSLLLDHSDNLWVSTNRGLSNIESHSQVITNYYKSDGLQGEVFLNSSRVIRQNGELVFGGRNGFNIFDPSKIKKPIIQDIHISGIYLFNKNIPIAYWRPS